MSAKNYEKRCARLVQEANRHQSAHPDLMPYEDRTKLVVAEAKEEHRG